MFLWSSRRSLNVIIGLCSLIRYLILRIRRPFVGRNLAATFFLWHVALAIESFGSRNFLADYGGLGDS